MKRQDRMRNRGRKQTREFEGRWGEGRRRPLLGLPRTDILLGRMVTAPSATSSRRSTGALLEPQLSEPIQKKWPVWLALRAASNTLLWGHSNPAQTCKATQLPQAVSESLSPDSQAFNHFRWCSRPEAPPLFGLCLSPEATVTSLI